MRCFQTLECITARAAGQQCIKPPYWPLALAHSDPLWVRTWVQTRGGGGGLRRGRE